MTQTIFPAVRYRDADAALEWLRRAFGAQPRAVHRDGDRVAHAEVEMAGNLFMLGQYDDAGFLAGEPPRARASTVSIYAVVPDPDEHHARARQAGAEVVRELENTPYGSREYSVRDLEGNLWSFGTYSPNG